MTEEKDLTLQGEIQRLKETINIQAKDYIELKQEYKQAHEDFICSDTALRIANTELDELKQENETINKDLLTERQENAELATENHNLRNSLETIRTILNVKCSIIANAECVGIINEVLNESI